MTSRSNDDDYTKERAEIGRDGGADRQGQQRAFTLIELLVVMATVALLAAILAPATQRAGRHARAVVCQSQLRQWGVGFAAFLDEYDSPIADAQPRRVGSVLATVL